MFNYEATKIEHVRTCTSLLGGEFKRLPRIFFCRSVENLRAQFHDRWLRGIYHRHFPVNRTWSSKNKSDNINKRTARFFDRRDAMWRSRRTSPNCTGAPATLYYLNICSLQCTYSNNQLRRSGSARRNKIRFGKYLENKREEARARGTADNNVYKYFWGNDSGLLHRRWRRRFWMHLMQICHWWSCFVCCSAIFVHRLLLSDSCRVLIEINNI